MVSLYIARLSQWGGGEGFTCSKDFYLRGAYSREGGQCQHYGVRGTTGRQTCFPARIFKEGCGVAKRLVRWSPGFES